MKDSSLTDKKELLVDYIQSWSLRCATGHYDNSKLTEYSKNILFLFLGKEFADQSVYNKIEVETWKNWENIDVCAEVTLHKTNGAVEKHAISIENKVYTTLHDNQLARYKTIFEDEYKGTDFEGNLHYVFFTCQDEVSEYEREECSKVGYKPFSMDEVVDKTIREEDRSFTLTGSDLFDEFWLTTW